MMKQVNIRNPFRMLVLMLGLFLSVGAFAQIDVKGHVKDAQGEPVIGATVRVVGTQTATVTDFDGNFALKANQGADITVTYVGYQDATVKAAPNLVITLREDAAVLNEVVVIGYGQVKKSDLTGSVTAMRPDSKNKGVVVNPQDMIAGKVAGVNITSNDGAPGSGAMIRIRGGSSLNASNDPLIVIDGLAMDNEGVKGLSNPLSMINPADIESFNVLKDASATAIYGSRGSNGVIIITTKKGRKGALAPQVSYSGSLTISNNKKTLEVMNGDEYRAFITKMYGEGSIPVSALGTANTNWQDEIFRTAISHDHNVTVAGAVKNLPYRVSVGYTDQQGTLKTSDFKRVTASLNLNPSFFNDHLTMNLNAKGMYAETQYADGGAVGAAVYYDPTQDPHAFTSEYHKQMLGNDYDKTLSNFGGYFQWPAVANYDGDTSWPYGYNSTAGIANPLSLLYGRDQHARSRSFIGSADIDYKVHGFEDLRLHLTLGADISKGIETTNNERWYTGSWYYGSNGDETILKRNHQLSAYAQYYKDFAKVHHFDIMGGYEWQHFWRDQKNDYVGTYPSTSPKWTDPSTSPLGNAVNERPHTPYHFRTDSYLVSFFGRANYSLLDRYMITATIRHDGSSRFKEHWSTSPSVALAWKINEEPFLKSVEALSELKLRLSWGQMPQQAGAIPDYSWIPTYSMNTGTDSYYPVAGDGTLYRPDNYTPNLKWEKTTSYNIGFDWGIFNQRLSGTIDVYYRKTTDLLNYAPTKALSAYRNQAWQNIGSLENKGIEATISWKPVQTKDWFWKLDYNITYNKNEITDLSGVSEDGSPVPNTGIKIGVDRYLQYQQVGHPINSFYVFQQAYDSNGKPIENAVVDRNGDGQITQADKYFYKSPAAPVTMGLASRVEYKNFDFSFSLRASLGNYVYNNNEQGLANVNATEVWKSSLLYMNNYTYEAVNRNWQTYQITSQLSDYYVHNASFLKCDNITLGYSFNDLFKSASYHGLSGRLSIAAQNVFTITKYEGLDPEVGNGFDSNMYPRPFSVVVGLNLNF
ncbi:MAG: TonB-dependent receptor [Prevotella sp.]|nr:TonB-dependent receptor [Prevotella sp.]